MRKRISADYRLYLLFLGSFVLFLIGRISWVYSSEVEAILVLYARMLLLLGIGIPSLLIATSKQSGLPATRTLYVLPYGIGGILAIAYILFYDYGSLRWFFNESAEEVFNGINAAHQIQIIGAIVQLIIPCSLLIIKEMIGKRQLKLLLFLSGGLIFGLSLVIGVGTKP
ncbi:hypothetical protein MY04_05595 [Flammeovirga sp. MY04]|uniref:hypothetical protein n=1 Tax=Flammeovirga sp. MY04 TaxID=1191459 RepID=UPI0013053609|nr:hypothetical protein [Flammeovirga sp. MY04]QJD09380.1 hypothetical protein MY04_05595 [Flammeovirga sp. MY04]